MACVSGASTNTTDQTKRTREITILGRTLTTGGQHGKHIEVHKYDAQKKFVLCRIAGYLARQKWKTLASK